MKDSNIVRIPDSHFRIPHQCAKCKQVYDQVIRTVQVSCIYCKHEGIEDLSLQKEYMREAARTPFYLIQKIFEAHDSVLLHVNDTHAHVARHVAESYAKAFGCEIIDEGCLPVISKKSRTEIIVNQLRIKKNDWLKRLLENKNKGAV